MTKPRRDVLARLGVVMALGVVASCAGSRAAGIDPEAPAPATSPASSVAPEPTTPESSRTTTTPPAPPAKKSSPASAPSTKTSPSPTTSVPARHKPSTTVTTTITSSVSPIKRADWAVFDDVLSDRLIGGGDQAASVAVAVDGKIVHRAAYGLRTPRDGAAPSDRFRIASISKPMAATAVMRLVEAGRLELDQPALPLVATLLDVPVADPRANGVTVRRLLGHTSGVGGFDFELLYAGSGSCHQAAAIALSQPLTRDPGTSYRYSNMNYCLVGLLLEAVTGRTFESVIRQQVLEPVGAGKMRVAGTGDVGKRDALHPTSKGRNYMDTLGASGSWISSASDVVRFVDSLDRAKPGWHPLRDKSVARMKAPSIRRDPGGIPGEWWYGLGLMVFTDGSYGHTGTLENTHAMTMARPDGVTWAVLVNGKYPSNSADLRQIVDEALLRAVAGR